jgi:hypothetical protein
MRSYQQECDDFCLGKCSFFNTSLGEHGHAENLTLYRLTPVNVTGIRNKDIGDAPGDVSFFLSKKNLTQKCAVDPSGWGCFLDGDNIYGRFVVEVDGAYGPYFECNPIDVYEAAPSESHREPPHWIDTRKFECGQGCLQPTDDDCHVDKRRIRNGTFGFSGAMQCFCDGTGRHNITVGREVPPGGNDYDVGPAYWQPQCRLSYYEYYDPLTKHYGGCLQGAQLPPLPIPNVSFARRLFSYG